MGLLLFFTFSNGFSSLPTRTPLVVGEVFGQYPSQNAPSPFFSDKSWTIVYWLSGYPNPGENKTSMEIDFIEVAKWGSGVIIFLVSIGYTIRHFTAVRMISYIERFNNPALAITLEELQTWSSKGTFEERKQQLSQDKKLYYKAMLIYNMLTEIAVAHKYRVVHRKMFNETFDPLYLIWYLRILPIIHYRNEEEYGGKKVLGNSAEKLFNKLRKVSKIQNMDELLEKYTK